jgi:hypothetical protein
MGRNDWKPCCCKKKKEEGSCCCYKFDVLFLIDLTGSMAEVGKLDHAKSLMYAILDTFSDSKTCRWGIAAYKDCPDESGLIGIEGIYETGFQILHSFVNPFESGRDTLDGVINCMQANGGGQPAEQWLLALDKIARPTTWTSSSNLTHTGDYANFCASGEVLAGDKTLGGVTGVGPCSRQSFLDDNRKNLIIHFGDRWAHEDIPTADADCSGCRCVDTNYPTVADVNDALGTLGIQYVGYDLGQMNFTGQVCDIARQNCGTCFGCYTGDPIGPFEAYCAQTGCNLIDWLCCRLCDNAETGCCPNVGDDCCPDCPCSPFCCPSRACLEITDISNGVCLGCEGLNGTYILSRESECCFSYIDPQPNCYQEMEIQACFTRSGDAWPSFPPNGQCYIELSVRLLDSVGITQIIEGTGAMILTPDGTGYNCCLPYQLDMCTRAPGGQCFDSNGTCMFPPSGTTWTINFDPNNCI